MNYSEMRKFIVDNGIDFKKLEIAIEVENQLGTFISFEEYEKICDKIHSTYLKCLEDSCGYEEPEIKHLVHKELIAGGYQKPLENVVKCSLGIDIDDSKLQKFISDDLILEFNNAKECLEYFNVYDFQKFNSVYEMQKYQGIYGFGVGEKWYHINLNEAFDIYNIDKNKITEKSNLSLSFDAIDDNEVVCIDLCYDNSENSDLCDVVCIFNKPATKDNILLAQEFLSQFSLFYNIPAYDNIKEKPSIDTLISCAKEHEVFEREITEITKEQAHQLLEYMDSSVFNERGFSPRLSKSGFDFINKSGLYYVKEDNGAYAGLDYSCDTEGFVEDFENLNECKAWLCGEFEIDRIDEWRNKQLQKNETILER